MKFLNIKVFLLAVVISAVTTSCGDGFLSTEPDNYTPEDMAITTAATARDVMNSAYDALRSDKFYGGQVNLLSDLMGDHLEGNNLQEGDWKSHYNRITNIFQGTTRDLMQFSSKAIGRCNNLLRYIDNISDLGDAERNRMKAECKFIKAICWFEQVRMFAQPYGFSGDVNGTVYSNNGHPGIAMWEEFANTSAPRESVGAVYAKITQYLEDAAAGLPATNGIYANKYAALGFLAKVRFQMNDFQKAYDAANDVIENSGVAFDTNFDALKSRFSKLGCTESVFSLVSTKASDNSGGKFSEIFPQVGDPKIFLSYSLYDKTKARTGDLRDSLWMQVKSLGANAYVFCKKFNTDAYIQVPLIHITEMKLIRAEAAAELNMLTVAEQDIQDVRTRAHVSGSVSGATQQQLISLARDEREIELIFENNHFHEMKRISVRDNTARIFSGSRESDRFCPGLVCQFPDNELKGNSNFEANPQGSCQ